MRGEPDPKPISRRRRKPKVWSLAVKGEEMCRLCPAPATDLHHIVPRSRWPNPARDDPRNGLPLCHAHHMAWHNHTEHAPTWRDITGEEWAYVTTHAPIDAEWLVRNYPARRAA